MNTAWPWTAALAAAAYLYGSINWAIIITRRVTGQDIRKLGTGNPGAANVGRQVGRGWGAVVYFLDLSKGLLPLLAGRLLVLREDSPWNAAILALAGIAAIAGHCRSIFHGFRGGGGIAASMGVFLFLIPVEFMASVLLGFAAAMSLRRRVRFVMGQWTPILFVAITPFLTLALNRLLYIPFGGYWSIGGHPWQLLAALFLISLFILAMNIPFMRSRAAEIRSADS